MVHARYAARLYWQVPLSEDVHRGDSGGVVHAASCSAGGAECYQIFPATMGDGLER